MITDVNRWDEKAGLHHTDDFWSDYHTMKERGVNFKEVPLEESYGTVAVFADIYGNRWDLLQLKEHG